MAFTDKIQKIPTKARIGIFAGFIIVQFIVYVWQVHIPGNDKIAQLETSISDLQAKIRVNDEKIKKLDELKAEVKSLQERLVVLTAQLPPESEVSGLLRQIQNLVTQSGLTLRLWKPERRVTHSSGLYLEIPISLDLGGSYHNTAVFFDRVSKMTRIVNILNLKMGSPKFERPGVFSISINCTAMTFAAVEKK